MKRKYLFLMVITGLLVSLDQLVKLYVHTQFRLSLEALQAALFIQVYRDEPGSLMNPYHQYLADSRGALRRFFREGR